MAGPLTAFSYDWEIESQDPGLFQLGDSTGVLFGMMPCLTDWLGSAGSFYLKPPTGNLGTRTAIRTTVRPQLAHGRDSQSRPNLSYRRLEVLAKFRPLAARGSAQLLNLVQLYDAAV